MARDSRHQRQRRRRQNSERRQRDIDFAQGLETVAILLLADAEDDAEELVALMVARLAMKAKQDLKEQRYGRYGPRGRYDRVKSKDFFDLLLEHFSDRWFRGWLRMSRQSFWDLHDLIRDDPIFLSGGRKPQRVPKYQLATFLCRVGSTTALKTAAIMSIAEGTVYSYVFRVVKAFRKIRSNHLAWPGDQRRKFLSSEMKEYGFPGCLGMADGSFIHLTDKPVRQGWSYFCRKGFYALILQATVDFRGIFTSFEFGWPGSVADARVFRNSHLWLHRDEYFRQHEYIIVDKGYPLTNFTIRPFTDFDLTTDREMARIRKRWNYKLSTLRIYVEHAFGRLKGRFPILRGLPGRDLDQMYKLIEALMIIHNILEARYENPATIPGFNGAEDDDVRDVLQRDDGDAEEEHDDNDLHRMGMLRRKELVEYMLRREREGRNDRN